MFGHSEKAKFHAKTNKNNIIGDISRFIDIKIKIAGDLGSFGPTEF